MKQLLVFLGTVAGIGLAVWAAAWLWLSPFPGDPPRPPVPWKICDQTARCFDINGLVYVCDDPMSQAACEEFVKRESEFDAHHRGEFEP